MQLPPINGSPSIKVLGHLSRDICKFWKPLGLELQVPNSKIDEIQADNVQYPGVTEKSFQMLMAWLNQGESATFDKLSEALKKLGEENLRKKYCGGL